MYNRRCGLVSFEADFEAEINWFCFNHAIKCHSTLIASVYVVTEKIWVFFERRWYIM